MSLSLLLFIPSWGQHNLGVPLSNPHLLNRLSSSKFLSRASVSSAGHFGNGKQRQSCVALGFCSLGHLNILSPQESNSPMPFGFTASNSSKEGQLDKGKHGKADPSGTTEDVRVPGFALLGFWLKMICGRADPPDVMKRAQMQMERTTFILAPKLTEQCQCRGQRLACSLVCTETGFPYIHTPQCGVTNRG